MKITKENLFFSIVDGKMRDQFLDLDFNMNMEVPIFCSPDILDGDWSGYVQRIKGLLRSKSLTCGMHGPFYSLSYHSRDSMVRDVAEKRMLQGLQIASDLGSRYIVFHSTFSQYVAERGYFKHWQTDAIKGLKNVVDEAERRKIPIVMENIWDDGPIPLKGLLEGFSSEFLKICIDVGHLNLFSKVPISQWFEVLSSDILHFHLHNNFGEVDNHNSLNHGSFDFKRFFDLVKLHHIKATYTIEVEKIESVNSSIKYLEELGVLEPF